MGKRLQLERPPTDRSIRKRKRSAIKAAEKHQRVDGPNNYEFHENDDEDSSSSGSAAGREGARMEVDQLVPATLMHTPQGRGLLLTGASFASDHNNSSVTESPRPVYTLRPSVVNGTILRDVLSKAWRLGRPIGKGNFGEIFLASDDTVCPTSSENAKYVVKIEPHSNGPLFVEIHCLINTSQSKDPSAIEESVVNLPAQQPLALAKGPPSGIPSYIASGTHYFGDARYRFLVLPRFDRDLHSLIRNSRVQQKSLLVLAIHIIDVLENLHDKGYCHNDIKAQNLMVSKCKYLKRQEVRVGAAAGVKNKGNNFDDHYEEKQQTTDSGNSSEQETNDDDFFLKSDRFPLKRIAHIDEEEDDEDEDFDDGATSNSNNSNSMDVYHTPINKKRRGRNNVQFSGSNPVRSCRREKRNSMYEEMVKSHYLRPTKRISYREEFNEAGDPIKQSEDNSDQSAESSDNESEEFIPPSERRSTNKRGRLPLASSAKKGPVSTRATRNQEKVKKETHGAHRTRGRGNKLVENQPPTEYQFLPVEEEHVFLIDFGLASKYQDRGVHRPFIMDQRRAHDGTLEFTSRDAHLGAHSRRSDLECLGYNLVYWSQGCLPWKDAAQQQQQEKVHRSKELFMTDVPEMLRQFYGKQVPKYLGEFLQQIGKLAYQERPNYERYRKIFRSEYQNLGFDLEKMRLSSEEIQRTCVSVKDEVDGSRCDIFELNNKITANVMRNSALNTPFQEHSLTNRVSPKNLRSKSSKKTTKKKFSWAEVLSQDPDQIARERAVKEFEREESICPLQSRLPRRYDGKPTYAILAVEQSRRDKGLVVQEHNEEEDNDDDEDEDEDDEKNEEEDTDEQEEEENDEVEEEEVDGSDYSNQTARAGRGRPKGSRKRTTSKPGQAPQPPVKCNRVAARRLGAVSKNRSTPLSAVASNKRGCATRKENTSLASAAGEPAGERKLKAGREKSAPQTGRQPKQRQTRRCLYKTESQLGENDVENNANLLEVQNLYGEYDDENNYGKGRHVHASRHCRK
ncbi:hypothetical protein KR074_007989 [Drosophila pseudoananassae]|nr:hypothetical protein KR074_007989 [Drosophila pseudoananassae]